MQTNERSNNWIKAYIVDVLPCIAVAIYILAVVFNIAYYSVFNINILHYLSLSDMLLSISDTLVVLAFFSLFLIWYALFSLTQVIAHEVQLDKTKKEKFIKHVYRFVPMKCMRLLVKIKNSKIGRTVVDYKKKRDEEEMKRQKRSEELNKNRYYHSWSEFFFASFLMGLSYYIYLQGMEIGDLKGTGMLGATVALLLPVALYCLLPAFFLVIKYILSIPFIGQMRLFQLKPIELLEIILVYYVYAVVIFYQSGIDSGNYYKNNDLVEFSIKAVDGTEFQNSSYRYINISNERIFLLDKNSNETLILSNEGIAYMKLAYKDASSQSTIVRFLNKMVEDNKRKQKK